MEIPKSIFKLGNLYAFTKLKGIQKYLLYKEGYKHLFWIFYWYIGFKPFDITYYVSGIHKIIFIKNESTYSELKKIYPYFYGNIIVIDKNKETSYFIYHEDYAAYMDQAIQRESSHLRRLDGEWVTDVLPLGFVREAAIIITIDGYVIKNRFGVSHEFNTDLFKLTILAI